MINEAFDQPKKIAAITADGRRTYRYARDEQELAKKQDQLRKAGASSIRVEEVQLQELSPELKQRYRRAAKDDIQTGENARHKGYPEKEIDARQEKRFKGLDRMKRLNKEGVEDYIEVKGGNMSKKEIDKLVAKRKKELGEDLTKSSDKLDLLRHLISKSR